MPVGKTQTLRCMGMGPGGALGYPGVTPVNPYHWMMTPTCIDNATTTWTTVTTPPLVHCLHQHDDNGDHLDDGLLCDIFQHPDDDDDD